MKSVSAVLVVAILTVFTQHATAQDPRAIGIRLERGVEEKGRTNYFREESSFSIAVYGPIESRQVYRIHGIDRVFPIEEFTALLTEFYETFPKEAKTKLGELIPVPNILYTHGVWMELTQAGPELVTALSRKNGFALYYVTITPGFKIHDPPPELAELTIELKCIAYYQKRLQEIAAKIGRTEKQDTDDKSPAPAKSKAE